MKKFSLFVSLRVRARARPAATPRSSSGTAAFTARSMLSRESPATEIEPAPCVSADATPSTETQYARLSVAIRCGSRASARAAAKTPKPLSDKASFLPRRTSGALRTKTRQSAARAKFSRAASTTASAPSRSRHRAATRSATPSSHCRARCGCFSGFSASKASRGVCGNQHGVASGSFSRRTSRGHTPYLSNVQHGGRSDGGSCAYAQSALHAFPRMNSLHAGVPSAAAGEQCSSLGAGRTGPRHASTGSEGHERSSPSSSAARARAFVMAWSPATTADTPRK